MKPGQVLLHDYHLDALIGEGGMGSVFRAHDRHGRPVAIKCVRGDRAALVERLAREARMLQQLSHPAIVRYLDIGRTQEGESFLVMEWLEGVDLRSRLRQGALTVDQALSLLERVAGALGAAHTRGMIHRDVKPGNIFLPQGHVTQAKLLDFGAARWQQAADLTATGTQIGTPMYMAPEQVRGEPNIGPAADIFALGCVLFECLTGKPAFAAARIQAVFYKILVEEAPSLRDLVSNVPGALDALLARMLAKLPAARPHHGTAMAEELERVRRVVPVAPDTTTELGAGHADVDGTLTRSERRLISVVAVAGEMGFAEWLRARAATSAPLVPPSLDETLPEMSPWHRVRDQFEALGARFEALGDGSLLVILDTHAAATDRAYHAARLALALRQDYPRQDIAIATGRAELAHERVVGEVIDRALEQLACDQNALPAPGIRVDDITSDLIDARFSLERDTRGAVLTGERTRALASRVMGKITPFVGRQREMATLTAALEQCIDESEALAVVITAPPGMGKSRIRREFARHVATCHQAITMWSGRSDPMRAGLPMGAIAEIIRKLARIREGEPLALRQQGLRASVARRVPAHDVDRVTMFLGELIGTQWPDPEQVQLCAARRDPQIMRDQVRQAFMDLVLAESRAQPLVIEIDDLHWSDQATVATLDMMLRNARAQPILLVAFGRSEVHELFPDLWARHDVMHVRLRPLSARSSERLVRAVLGASQSPDVVADLLARAQGNALYLEELMRNAVAGRGVSETVLAMIEVRLQSLPAHVRRVLRAASVFGDHFWGSGVAVLLGESSELEPTLERLVSAEVLVPVDASKFAAEPEHRFRHDLLREAAYNMLTDNDRILGHRLAAEWLEQAGERDALVLAEHFERGQDNERAIPWFVRAAQNALGAEDLAGCVRIADRGISCGALGHNLGSLLRCKAEAHKWQGAYEAAAAAGELAMALLSEGSRAWYTALRFIVDSRGTLGQAEAVAAIGETLVRGRAVEHDVEGWLTSAFTAVVSLLMCGHRGLAGAVLDAADQELESAASPDRTSHVLGLAHHAHAFHSYIVDNNPARLLRELHQAITCHERAGDARNACRDQANAGCAENWLGLYEQAEPTLRASLQRAETLAIVDIVDSARMYLSQTLLHRGQALEARALAVASARSYAARDNPRMTGASWVCAALAALSAGDLPDAEALAADAMTACTDMPMIEAHAASVLASVLLAGHRPDNRPDNRPNATINATIHAAMDAAQTAMDLLRELGAVEEGESRIRLIYAEALHATGAHERARDAILEARERLLERAARIDDPAWRQSFLDHVPENARTLELAERWCPSDP